MTETAETPLRRATLRDTLGVVAGVLAPTLAKGVIVRRPGVVALAARLDLDRRAIRRMQALRDRYGPGPLLLRLPARRQALILSPAHVARMLAGTPEPFAADSDEKRAALSHFEPQGVLISRGAARADRRRFNEAVLDTPRPAHHLADHFLRVVDDEAAGLLIRSRGGAVDWRAFTAAWHRIARRVVLGDAARDDRAVTDLLTRLRADANWAFLRPRRAGVRARFDDRLRRHLARAEPGSLAAVIAATPRGPDTVPSQQVPQWLFAFDAAGIAIFRALALLAAHPAQLARAREEVAASGATARPDRPFLRACVLEALRLWPTTPAVLRQSTAETRWAGGALPARTGLIIFAPFFHRDDRRSPHANRFAPELWLGDGAATAEALIPFSAGPAGCPGRNLVLLLTSATLAALLDARAVRLLPPSRLDADRPLPGTLDHFSLRFAFARPGADDMPR